MTTYIPPHLRDNKKISEKRVSFNSDYFTARAPEVFTKVNSYKKPTMIEYLENENANLKNEVRTLKERIDMLNRDVELYKGNREECIPKSSFDAVVDELQKFKTSSFEFSRKLKDIDDVHRNGTNSLRTEINILKEELKKSEKQISHLSSNVTSLAKENNHLKEVIELMKTPETKQESVDVYKEENKELIQEDWDNIKTSLRYLLSDTKLKKQFSIETGINLAGMKLTLEIIEKIN